MNETPWDMTPQPDTETVFKGKTVPMTREQSMVFIACSMAEVAPEPLTLEEVNLPFFAQVIKKRIETMRLPIEFTLPALLAVNALTDVVGGAVVILIDALTRYEGKKVGMGELADLYPTGFYDEATFTDYIDNYLKPRKVRWSEVY